MNQADLIDAQRLAADYRQRGTGTRRIQTRDLILRARASQNKEPCQSQPIGWLESLLIRLGLRHGFAQCLALGPIRKTSEQGLAPSQWDYRQALKWFRDAAEQGFNPAQFNLGLVAAEVASRLADNNDRSEEVPQSRLEAVKWFRLAAKQHLLGRLALKWFRKAVALAYVQAQSNRGLMYPKGEEVPQNRQEVVEWFRLGRMCFLGEEMRLDFRQAATWFRKAAEQGHAQAQFNLGLMYSQGLGVRQDFCEAYNWFQLVNRRFKQRPLKWFRKAAELVLIDVQYNLGRLALKWHRNAAEQGLTPAQHTLGVMYYQGEGVPSDYSQAATWFRKAAEQGHADSQNDLAVMYGEGKGVPQDFRQAATWYRKAAEQGHTLAQANLGLLYRKAAQAPKFFHFLGDMPQAQALKWFRKAAEQGFPPAQFNLGLMYDRGEGVPQDQATAYAWLSLAAEQGHAMAREDRDHLNKQMTPDQIAQAQNLAAELWERINPAHSH